MAADLESSRDQLVKTVFRAFLDFARPHNARQPINVLPDEVLTRILSSVPLRTLCTHGMLVCSQWRTFITNASDLWSRLDLDANCGRYLHRCRRGAALTLVEQHSATTPLSLTFRSIPHRLDRDGDQLLGGDDGRVDSDARRPCRCNEILARLMPRVRTLSLSGGLSEWFVALQTPAPALEVLHLAASDCRGLLRLSAFGGTAPKLRSVFLDNCLPMDDSDLGSNIATSEPLPLPTVTHVHLQSVPVDEVFRVFPNVEDLYVLKMADYIVDREASDDDSHDKKDAAKPPSSLQRLFVRGSIDELCAARHLFSNPDLDIVIAGLPPSWEQSLYLHKHTLATQAAVTQICQPATTASFLWTNGRIAMPENERDQDLHPHHFYLSVELDGHAVAFDISQDRINLLLRRWAKTCSLEGLTTLVTSVGIWHRMMIAKMEFPKLEQLTLVMSPLLLCCDWSRTEGLEQLNTGIATPPAVAEETEEDKQLFEELVLGGSDSTLSEDEVGSADDGPVETDEVGPAEDGPVETDKPEDTSLENDEALPSAEQVDPGYDGDTVAASVVHAQSNVQWISWPANLETVTSPRSPLRLKRLRLEGSAEFPQQPTVEGIERFVCRTAVPTVLERLEIGRGLGIDPLSTTWPASIGDAVVMDIRFIVPVIDCSPWFWTGDAN